MAITVITIENPSNDYGMYSWACGPVLAEYVYSQRNVISNKRVLELGAGTALPGVTAAKCGAFVTLTDRDNPRLMDHLQETCRLNGLDDVHVLPLSWGMFTKEVLSLAPVDYVLASDCLYQSSDFEDFLVTVSYFMDQNKDCKLWTAYQERSTDTSLSYLFKRWRLQATVLPPPQTRSVAYPNIPQSKTETQHNIILWEVTSLDN